MAKVVDGRDEGRWRGNRQARRVDGDWRQIAYDLKGRRVNRPNRNERLRTHSKHTSTFANVPSTSSPIADYTRPALGPPPFSTFHLLGVFPMSQFTHKQRSEARRGVDQ